MSDRAVTGIAVAITALWVVLNLLDALLGKAYDTPVMVHTIMGIVAGALFGEKVRRNKAPQRTLQQLGLFRDEEKGDGSNGR